MMVLVCKNISKWWYFIKMCSTQSMALDMWGVVYFGG